MYIHCQLSLTFLHSSKQSSEEAELITRKSLDHVGCGKFTHDGVNFMLRARDNRANKSTGRV